MGVAMQKPLGLLMLVAMSLTACAVDPSEEGDEVTDSSASAVVASIPGTSMTVISGYQTNTAILGVPVRAFWTNGEAQAWVYLPSGGTRTVVVDLAVTSCYGGPMGVGAHFVGSNSFAGADGMPPNSRQNVTLQVRAPAGGWQRLRISGHNDSYAPGVCDANLYVFNVTVH